MAVRENIGEAEGGGGRQDTCIIIIVTMMMIKMLTMMIKMLTMMIKMLTVMIKTMIRWLWPIWQQLMMIKMMMIEIIFMPKIKMIKWPGMTNVWHYGLDTGQEEEGPIVESLGICTASFAGQPAK